MGGEQAIPLAGRYRLLSVVGSGGMGTVWHAHDETLDRDVAVKEVVLSPRLTPARRRALCRRVIGEARATAALRHPGVLTVYDVVVEDGRPWIVEELLPARSLQDVLDAEGPLPVVRAAEVGRRVLAVLRAAHAAGIVHRDVKPSNVLLGDDGRIVLNDFGLAARLGDRPQPGMVEGSPGYASPEQARGEVATPASDLWSLGATLYAAVEGRSPYVRSHALASLVAVLLGEYRPPARAGALRPLIDDLLRAAPADRLPAEKAARMLDEAVARPPSAPPAPRRRRRPRAETIVSVTTLAAVVIGLGTWAARWNSVGAGETMAMRSPVTEAFDRYDGPGGYSVRVPAGWVRQPRADGVYWYDPGGDRHLRIGSAPGEPPASLHRVEDRAVASGAYPGYRRLRLEPAPELGDGAMEWEYTWRSGHALRSRIDGYEMYFVARDSRWTPSQRLFDAVLRTFRPPG